MMTFENHGLFSLAEMCVGSERKEATGISRSQIPQGFEGHDQAFRIHPDRMGVLEALMVGELYDQFHIIEIYIWQKYEH